MCANYNLRLLSILNVSVKHIKYMVTCDIWYKSISFA